MNKNFTIFVTFIARPCLTTDHPFSLYAYAPHVLSFNLKLSASSNNTLLYLSIDVSPSSNSSNFKTA